MTIQASTNWYVRAGGDETNGGGFDPSIAGAGTNFCDQDAAQLTLTDLACEAATPTTLRSAAGGFTAQMVGNCVRIDASVSGVNFIDGYFFVTGFTSSNAVTIDRTCNNGLDASGGTGRLGGAHQDIRNHMISGSGLPAPLIPAPTVPGNQVNIRGAGGVDPTVIEYDWSAGYWVSASGSVTDGAIVYKGYGPSNDRPFIEFSGLMIHNSILIQLIRVSARCAASPGFAVHGIMTGNGCLLCDSIVDSNGADARMAACGTIQNEFRNSGTKIAGLQSCVVPPATGQPCLRNYLHDQRGISIDSLGTDLAEITGNIVANGASDGIRLFGSSATPHQSSCKENTVYGCAGDGITIGANGKNHQFRDNIVTDNGGFGFNFDGDQGAVDSFQAHYSGSNAVYNNTSGNYNNTAGLPGDKVLTGSPFVDAPNKNFALNDTAGAGAECRGVPHMVGPNP